MPRLEGKIAVITGGGSGIGRAVAVLFADEGARVVITGRCEGPLKETAQAIVTQGGEVETAIADVADEAACEMVAGAAREAFGAPTVLVNNAGVFERGGRVDEMPLDEWDRTLAINLRGPLLMMRALIPGMLEAGGGSIVNIGSMLAEVAIPGASAYAASKGGLLMLTRSVALDLAAERIRCNMVSPGLTETPMMAGALADEKVRREILREYPMGRFAKPEDIAHAALHLASDESGFTTGAVLNVDGGVTAH
jgi:NAD(P)-dependent dehydrogenase (short-subunit alcohol dehydrogenase family)